MLSMMIKISVSFVVCFIVLSFQINNKPLFYHISSYVGPLGGDIQQSISKSFKRTYTKSKNIGEDLLKNSEPKINDAIRSARSSKKARKENEELILEEIKREEIQKLDEIIRNHK